MDGKTIENTYVDIQSVHKQSAKGCKEIRQ